MNNFLKGFNSLKIIVRSVGKHRFNWYDEGIQYFGFKYYPRYPDFKDPPYDPTKLFRVQRIKPLKGAPYWEKNILREFKLDGKQSDIAIIKNIPENNHRLWKVKHLIKITPITFPDGVPENIKGTYLKENGELVVKKELKPVQEKMELTDGFRNNIRKIDGDTLRRHSRKKWLNGWS